MVEESNCIATER